MTEYQHYRLALQQRLAAAGKTPAQIRKALAAVDAKAANRKAVCKPCSRGIVPGQPLTYSETCYQCAGKVAEGKRTGREPAPITLMRPARMPMVAFSEKVARESAARARRREYFLGTLPGRAA